MSFTSLSIKMYWWKNKQRNLQTFQADFEVCLRNDAVNYTGYIASVIDEWVWSIHMILTGGKTAPEAMRWEVGECLRDTVNTIRAGWSRNLGSIHGEGKTFWPPKHPGWLAPLYSTCRWLFNRHEGGRGVKLTAHLQSPTCCEGVITANLAYLKFRHKHTHTQQHLT